jgi:hypothetical protein
MRFCLCGVAVLVMMGCGTMEVERLNLRDPRLPIEARRWLADAEDEVAIVRARVENSEASLEAYKSYRESLISRLEETWTEGKASAQGGAAFTAFLKYGEERVKLAELTLEATRKELQLAKTRLTQARAETAIQYDLAVYEIAPIVHEVELLRKEVALMRGQMEDQRVVVERTASQVWNAYAKFVSSGGNTNALWGLPGYD